VARATAVNTVRVAKVARSASWTWSKEQREQIGKLMGGQWQARKDLVKKYLDKLPAADQKAMQDEIAAGKQKTQADIRAVLKPDQQKKFDEIVKKQEQRRAEWKEFQAWKAQQPQKRNNALASLPQPSGSRRWAFPV